MYICLRLPKFKGIKILRFISVAINLEKRIHKFRLIEWGKKYKYSRKYVFDELYLGFWSFAHTPKEFWHISKKKLFITPHLPNLEPLVHFLCACIVIIFLKDSKEKLNRCSRHHFKIAEMNVIRQKKSHYSSSFYKFCDLSALITTLSLYKLLF